MRVGRNAFVKERMFANGLLFLFWTTVNFIVLSKAIKQHG